IGQLNGSLCSCPSSLLMPKPGIRTQNVKHWQWFDALQKEDGWLWLQNIRYWFILIMRLLKLCLLGQTMMHIDGLQNGRRDLGNMIYGYYTDLQQHTLLVLLIDFHGCLLDCCQNMRWKMLKDYDHSLTW